MASEHVAAVRAFNRFYTQHIGVLDGQALTAAMSLTEARVLYELAHCDAVTASQLADALVIDPGYLSRILRGFAANDWIAREPAPDDARRRLVSLTASGRAAFSELDAMAQRVTAGQLAALAQPERARLVDAMRQIESIWRGDARAPSTCVLRAHDRGDIGWVLQRHAELYGAERGYDARFEALVARIVARFTTELCPTRERLWIAEVDGQRAGSIALARSPDCDDTALLRLLLVEPFARGAGVGKALVGEHLRFARAGGYRRVSLATESSLERARVLYERNGFARVSRTANTEFGTRSSPSYIDTYELHLASPPPPATPT